MVHSEVGGWVCVLGGVGREGGSSMYMQGLRILQGVYIKGASSAALQSRIRSLSHRMDSRRRLP